jgi:phospholipase C
VPTGQNAARLAFVHFFNVGVSMKHPVIFGCLTAAFAVSTVHGAQFSSNVPTRWPIKHLVVIFQENVSFDHYFGTYPVALNPGGPTGGTTFNAASGTPTGCFPAATPCLINTLVTPLNPSNSFLPLSPPNLLNSNPNADSTAPHGPNVLSLANGAGATLPFRLSHSQALTADQGHNDFPEQGAYDNGLMDGFPAYVGTAGPPPVCSPPGPPCSTTGLTMGYYDGNTVTALWNYAQFYAMNDNAYVTQFGPSTPGALNLVAGQTNGVSATLNVFNAGPPVTLAHPTHEAWGDATHIQSNVTEIGDGDPLLDVCSSGSNSQVTIGSKNIGDLLNAQGITWGAFMGGFDLAVVNPNGTTGCSRQTPPAAAGTPASTSTDYIPHHAWFQYFASTRNPKHALPSSLLGVGQSFIPEQLRNTTPEPANHQYDINVFFAALRVGTLPAVSFVKAPAFQDGHAGYSDPLDEQTFLVNTINTLQKSRYWKDTAVVIIYDDSDGWYDHQMPPIVNSSFNPGVPGTPVDILNGNGLCYFSNGNQQGIPPLPNNTPPLNGTFSANMWGRCGYGTRVPLLVLSPYARKNFVDHTLTDQTSVLRFIEDNWLNGTRLQPGASFDTIAGSIENMFDFTKARSDGGVLILKPTTGAP